MRKALTSIVLLALSLTAGAQQSQPKWYDNIKVSGYGMVQYQASDKYSNQTITDADGNNETVAVKDHDNSFNLRLMRVIMDGKVGDVDWRAQVQGSSNAGPGNPSVYLVDLFAEWVKYKEFRVKVGQFKRAFTFENPTHPITQGWYSYAMVINSLAGFGDRTGEKSSGGRDMGLQVQGDLLPNSNGRRLLHYQVGVYNGEGINQKDKDNRKDVIGGLWLMPVSGVRVGAFGWTGSRAGIGEKNRYALSAEYDKGGYTFRTEYIHSQGMGSNAALGSKADGLYAFGIVPVVKNKLFAKARYNMYRPAKEWSSSKTMYEIGANYMFSPKLQLNVEYALVNDRSIVNPDKHNYNFVDAQLDFRF